MTDPTNIDPRYTRNRIRAQLLPVLETCFPQFRDTFARSSTHAAQAQALLLGWPHKTWPRWACHHASSCCRR